MSTGSKILDRNKLDAAYITFSTAFDMVLLRTPTVFQDLATVIPVTDTTVSLKWLGDVPKMQEWIGPRAIAKLRAESHNIVTKKWANGLEVDRDDIMDDKLGLIQPRIDSLAQEGMWSMEDLVMDFLNAGTTTGPGGALCYDGQYLYDSDHTASGAGGTSQSNVVSGAFSETTYQSAWEKMMGFVDTKGNSLRVVPDTLVVGVANRTTARKLIEQQTKATGESNIEAGTTRLIVHPRVTTTKWSLHATRMAIRSIILLVRQAPQFAAVQGNSEDTATFLNDVFLYGADAKFGAGYGLWQTTAGGPGA